MVSTSKYFTTPFLEQSCPSESTRVDPCTRYNTSHRQFTRHRYVKYNVDMIHSCFQVVPGRTYRYSMLRQQSYPSESTRGDPCIRYNTSHRQFTRHRYVKYNVEMIHSCFQVVPGRTYRYSMLRQQSSKFYFYYLFLLSTEKDDEMGLRCPNNQTDIPAAEWLYQLIDGAVDRTDWRRVLLLPSLHRRHIPNMGPFIIKARPRRDSAYYRSHSA
ncbi:hypothetical protein J6590_051873 [Homalodisca vitripennis]|nr:hypothetical protein J6590_051873 [Homalodisca vitripennis]